MLLEPYTAILWDLCIEIISGRDLELYVVLGIEHIRTMQSKCLAYCTITQASLLSFVSHTHIHTYTHVFFENNDTARRFHARPLFILNVLLT